MDGRAVSPPHTVPSARLLVTLGSTFVLHTRLPPHLLQARGLILHILGEQNEHAEVFVLKGKLYDLAINTINVAHTERGFHIHHLHWFGVRL